jgi:ElaB/YqjD/DUF883 family membrane-anchored ribosome-binding protein
MDDVKNGAGATVEDATEKLSAAGSEMGRKAMKAAEEARKESAKALQKAADKVRSEVREGDNDEEAIKRADDVAAGLEKAALYLKETTVPEMEQQLQERVKAQPYQALLVAFIVGLVFGLLLPKGRR